MKTALVRLLTLATLATSLSAFAATGKSKHDDAANPSATTQQNGCAGALGEGKKEKKAQKSQEESQQEQDFDRVLMGIYG